MSDFKLELSTVGVPEPVITIADEAMRRLHRDFALRPEPNPYGGLAWHHRRPFVPAERKTMLTEACAKLRPLREAGMFDTLVGTGASGVVVAAILADRLDCDVVHIRKEGEGSAVGGRIVAHDRYAARWVFIDDLVSSGRTFRWVKQAINEYRSSWKLVGHYLYDMDQPHDFECLDGVPNLRFPTR